MWQDDGERRREKRPLKTLDRVISKAGVGSRVEAAQWIREGRVEVSGQIVRDPEHWVDLERDPVWLDGRPLEARERVYVLLHKPTGYLTTYRDPEGRPTVYDLLGEVGTFVSPVGRLDLETSGLLLLTNDTQFADRVTSPESHLAKTYRVLVSRQLSDEQLQQLRDGMTLKDGPTRPARVERIADSAEDTTLEISITEGRNRQVRRMIEALGAYVLELTRLSIGSIRIGTLEPGQWRPLLETEVRDLTGAPATQGHKRR